MSRKRVLAAFLVLLVALGAAPAHAGRAAIDVRLEVPVIAQRFEPADEYTVNSKQYRDRGLYDCAAASLAMVLGALKQAGRIDQGTAVDYAAVRKWLRQEQPNAAKGIHLATVADGASALTGTKVTAALKQSAGDTWKTTLGDSLSAGVPVIVQVAGPNGLGIAYGSGDHAIVVTGLTESEVFYNDPWEGTAGSMAADEFGKYWGRERTRYWALVFSAGTPADVAASPSPTAPPQKSVRDIDWNNREYLIVGSSVNEVVRVAGGEYSSTATCCASVVRAIVGPLLFGDVTDDGAEEAVVTMRWHHGGNFWESTVAVFSMRGSEPHQIATTALGADMDGDVRGVRLEGAWIVVTVSHGVDGDSHARGPTHVRDEFWRWNGSELIEDVARRNVVALASPSPASGDAQKVNAAAVGIIGGPLVPPPLTTDACRKANPPAGKGCVEQVGESETLRRGYAIVRAANPPDIGGGGTLILGRTASGAWGYYFSQQQAVKPGPLPTTGRICSSGGLNVRDRPSADGGIVTVLPDDSLQSLERFELAEGPTGQGWFGVRTSSGATGWVAGAYVYAESLPCSAAPLR